MHKMILAELKYSTYMPEMPEKSSGWCTEVSSDPPQDWLSAVTKASGFLADAVQTSNRVDIHTAHSLVTILPMFISRMPLSTIEDTYVQQVLSPMLQSVFKSDERLEIEWSNAVLAGSVLKAHKPDFTVFSHTIDKKCVFLVSEFKPTKSNSAVESDLVKLGRQMRSTFNDLVNHRVNHPIVCGVRSQGTRLTTYAMDMPSPHLYRMTKLSEISLFENVEQLTSLPNIVMKLIQLRSITAETLNKAESYILKAAKTNHRGPAFPPLSWLSRDSYMLQRKPKSSAK